MKVAAWQAPLLTGEATEVLRLIRTEIECCETHGVEILCCPEGIIGGLADYAATPSGNAIRVDDGSLDEMLQPLGSDTVTIIVGFTEIDRDQRLFNSAAVYHRGEIAGVYRKLFPAINRSVYDAGEETPVFTIGSLTFGILICNDSNFIEPADVMVAHGAAALFVPSNNGLPEAKTSPGFVTHTRKIDIARAIEKNVTIIRSDVAGRTSQLVSYGTTAIIGADGRILGAVEPCRTGLIVAEIEATPGALRTPEAEAGNATAPTRPP